MKKSEKREIEKALDESVRVTLTLIAVVVQRGGTVKWEGQTPKVAWPEVAPAVEDLLG